MARSTRLVMLIKNIYTLWGRKPLLYPLQGYKNKYIFFLTSSYAFARENLFQEVLSASPLQTNVSIVNANIDRQRNRMLNFPQFIVVYFLFPRRSLTHHQVFFFWLTNKSQNRTASDEPREELGA